jgi:hypothetical protein
MRPVALHVLNSCQCYWLNKWLMTDVLLLQAVEGT